MKTLRKLRSAWEEFKLGCRVLTAAVKAPTSITPVGRLYATKVSPDGSTEDLGLISTKVVTDAGVNAIVQGFLAAFTIANFNFHASGTGTTAEAASQTALVTEVATRSSGAQTVGASNNIYRTVATITYGASLAITEHGIFSASSVGTLLDRSVFAAINVISGDSIQFTYELTLPSGS